MTSTRTNQRHFASQLGLGVALLAGTLCSRWAAAQPQVSPPSAPSPANATNEPAAPPADREAASVEEEAPIDTDAFAQRHWHSGMAYLKEGDYAKALEAFTKAYELSERPSVLRSIAVAHEKLGDLSSALAAVDLYLQQVPDAPDVTDIQAYRAELQRRLDQDTTTTGEMAPVATPSSPATKTAPTRYVLPQTEDTPPPTPAPDANTRTVVMWSAASVGVLVGAGAVWTGLAAKDEFADLEQKCPPCTRDQTHEGRTLAMASTVLTGLAALAGGAAIWAWLDDGDTESGSAHAVSAGLAPASLDVGYSNERFMSYAGWRF